MPNDGRSLRDDIRGLVVGAHVVEACAPFINARRNLNLLFLMPCSAPNVICNNNFRQDPQTQRYLELHLLAALINAAGGSVPTTDSGLFDASSGYLCQGSPAKLRTEEATAIANADLSGVDLPHITCYSPLAIESAMAYLTCVALDTL